ncbi:MAG: hypothetical protein WAO78_10510 [Roseovarius sp.]
MNLGSFAIGDVLLAGATIALTMASHAQADAIIKPMNWTSGSGMPSGPIDGTSLVLERGAFGVTMAIKSSGLTSGDVVPGVRLAGSKAVFGNGKASVR